MSCGRYSGVTDGYQMSFENQEAERIAAENEKIIQEQYEYLKYELPKSSPIYIPETAIIKEQHKNGYDQVQYKWTGDDGYKYLCRWHTHTPGAPDYSQVTWVVERQKPGIGSGKEHRLRIHEVFVAGGIWIDWSIWDAAKKARKYHCETKEQRELLDNGHWKA